MSTPKQPHLNGAYYGPSIPPPSTKSYHRPGRGGGGCNPFSWCCSCICGCIFNLICQIFITILVVLGITVFILWLIFRPNVPKFHVENASLTRFDLSTTNNTLYYNLNLNMTFRNPNKRMGIYYDRIEARAFYHGQRFDSVELQTFYLGHKKESYPTVAFNGQQVVVLGSGDQSKYNSEKSDLVYKIDLKIYLKIRFKVGWSKTPKFSPKIECNLNVPTGNSGTRFQRTKCDFDW